MSYNILYRAIAIKHPNENKFCIISERGDNNVWETLRNRRARSWTGDSMVGCGQGEFYTPNEIENQLKTIDFESGCYVVYGRKYGFTPHWNIYKKAIVNAISFQTATKFNLRFSIWTKGSNHHLNVPDQFDWFCQRRDMLNSNELNNFWLIADVGDHHFQDIYPPKPKKERIPRKGTHCIYIVGYGYLYKRSSRRVFPTSNKKWALQYSEKEATKLVEILNNRGFDCTFEAEPINS